ncbi:hypothetical protein ACRRTK_022503 [Alexandromys fortis]
MTMDRDSIISRGYDLINETIYNDQGPSCVLMMESSMQSGTATCVIEVQSHNWVSLGRPQVQLRLFFFGAVY